MPYLHALEIEHAPYRHSQPDILRFMVERFKPARKERMMMESSFAGSGISNRSSVLPDFSSRFGRQDLFDDKDEPAIEERMRIYVREGEKLIANAAKRTLESSGLAPKDVTHLVVFSCTGLVNPGFENCVMEACDLPAEVETQGIYFAGCHGAFKAIKLAKTLAQCALNDKPANVLVCGLELCTLHFIPGRTGDQIRANTIFADGCAGFMVSSDKPSGKAYSLGGVGQETIRTATPLMSWNVGSQAFFMTLSSKIDQALDKFNLTAFVNRVNPGFEGNVICHPGGKSILEAVGKQVEGAFKTGLATSYDVLSEQGNMSSISILHVLKKEMAQATHRLMALGFGPGLTIEGLHLQPC